MQYRIKAVRGEEPVISLLLDAADDIAASQQARSQGYSVIAIAPDRLRVSGWMARGSSFPTLQFSQQLLALLEAGLSLIEALEALGEKETRPEARRVVSEILTSLYQGQTLSNAIARFPQYFPQLYVAAIRASEKTGDLPRALTRYITYREQMDTVRNKVISASIYPALLLLVGGLVIAFLLFYVVPRFSRVYEDISTDLPLFSAILLQTGRFITNYGWIFAAAVLALIITAIYLLLAPSNRAALARKVRSLPAVGERIRVYEHARLYRTLGMLLRGGIPVTQAMEMTAGLTSTDSQTDLGRAITLIREGKSISTAMEAARFTSPITSRMLVVGERSGNMGEMMDRIAQFHDEDLARWVEWFTKLFEPALMAVIGVIIGLIVVMMYMPIFELASSVR
jgi:general secretion pathway protein F